jgi:multidrug efflux pump subunit AcrA (membrane-fusion protein)
MSRTGLVFLMLAATLGAAGSDRARNTVILDEVAVQNLQIETVQAEESSFEETIFALGRIKVAPGHRAVVSSRVPGRVLRVSAHIDTPIEKGAEVMVLESRQPGDPPPTVTLVAPIAGLVSVMNVVPGLPVSPDAALMEIVDLSDVHAVAAVPEHSLGQLKIGQKGRVRVPGYPDREFAVELAHIGAEADAEGGTLEAAFHLPNPDALLRPGMRAEFSIVVNTRDNVMAIPHDALQGDPSGRFVYVKDFELKNAFVKTPVQIGAQNDRIIEITRGLLPGDEVVTRGAYSLAFAGKGSVSLKEAMDAAHGHAHNEDGSEITKEQLAAKAGNGGHEHEHGVERSPLVTFLIATNALLFLLLVASAALRRRPATA